MIVGHCLSDESFNFIYQKPRTQNSNDLPIFTCQCHSSSSSKFVIINSNIKEKFMLFVIPSPTFALGNYHCSRKSAPFWSLLLSRWRVYFKPTSQLDPWVWIQPPITVFKKGFLDSQIAGATYSDIMINVLEAMPLYF